MKSSAEFPPTGLGAEKGTSEGDKAVKAIKAMDINCIERAVLDEAGAIDGSRPLEQIADACGHAWGFKIQGIADGWKRIHSSTAILGAADVRSIRSVSGHASTEEIARFDEIDKLDRPCKLYEAAEYRSSRTRCEAVTMDSRDCAGWKSNTINIWSQCETW